MAKKEKERIIKVFTHYKKDNTEWIMPGAPKMAEKYTLPHDKELLRSDYLASKPSNGTVRLMEEIYPTDIFKENK